MSDENVRLERVEQALSSEMTAKVMALWQQENAIIENTDERLTEIRALAWNGENLVGVASIGVMEHKGIRKPLFILRALVSSRVRQQGPAYLLYRSVVEWVEERFDDGTDTRAIGVYVEVEAVHMPEYGDIPCTFSHTHSQQNRPVAFNLVNITDQGFPQFIYFFENASLFDEGPIPPETVERGELLAGATVDFCWKKLTSADQQQIIGLWLSHGMFTTKEACMERLPQVAATAREEGTVVAVASIFRAEHPISKVNLIGIRAFSSPDARGSFYATKLFHCVFDELNRTYKDDPELQHYHGMGMAVQNDRLSKSVVRPRGKSGQTCLAGYAKDRQFRVRYFDDAFVKMSNT
ncbi:MAG: hypothetical protein AAGI11_09820 [Pseudomonadota bacterium]